MSWWHQQDRLGPVLKNYGGKLQVSFYKESKAASSYRGELLGMGDLLLIALDLETFFSVKDWLAQLLCGNKVVLYQEMWGLRQIKLITKFNDLLQSIQSSGNQISGRFVGKHVDSHMDCYLLWYQLTIKNQLNVLCNQLAKGAVTRGIHDRLQRRDWRYNYLQVLQREVIALFDKGENSQVI